MNECPNRPRSAAPQCGSGDVKAKGLVAGVGAGIPAGKDVYFTLLRNMAKSFRTCLSEK